MKANRKKIYLLAFLFIATSCASGSSTDESCSTGPCTESSINAPKPGASPVNEKPKPPPINAADMRFPPYDPSWELKKSTYDKAVQYFEENKYILSNPRFFTIVDLSQHSSKKRFYLFDLSNDSVERFLTSHGLNSDLDNDGYATEFSNIINSKQSSLGFYLTLTTYSGVHGYSLRLRGLESSNSNAEERAIVVHPADYIQEANSKAGRSWGCPALDPQNSEKIIEKIRDGSLLLIDR